MEVALALLAFLLLLLLGVPIWAIVAALRGERLARGAQEELHRLSKRLDLLEKRLPSLARFSAGKIEGSLPTEPAAEASVPRPISPPEPSATPIAEPLVRAGPSPPQPPPNLLSLPERIASEPHPASSAPPPSPPQATSSFDWESLISVRAFAWLGGGALFLGAALFLQYSIQHGLISPAGRVAIGLLVGAAALLGGDFLRARAEWAGHATSGAGVAILYASLFAAHARYQLLGTPMTFGWMAFVTLVAGVMAVRRQAFVLAVLGLLGGFLTPYLLSTKEDHPLGLLAYVLLLDLGMIAVARRRGWLSIRLMMLVGSAALYAGWAAAHLNAEKLPYALAAAILVAGLFLFAKPEGEGDPDRRDLARAIVILAIAGPLLLAVVVAPQPQLALSPTFLVSYLLVLSGGAVFVSRRTEFSPLVPIAAGFCVLTLTLRVGKDLFPPERAETLLLFALVPAAFFLLWWMRRGSDPSAVFRTAAAITLFGMLPILFRILEVELGQEPIALLWLYAFAHAAGLLAIGTSLGSGAWVLSSQALLFFSLLSLTGRFAQPRLSEFLPFLGIPILLFWILPFLSPRLRRDRHSWLSSAAAPVVHYPVVYVLAKPAWGAGPLGAIAVLFGVAALLALRRAAALPWQKSEDRQFVVALFGAVTLLFVTAAIPILLDREWITVAWALEAAGLAWLSTRVEQNGMVQASALLAGGAFLRLIANPAVWSYYPRSGTPVFNWYLYTFGIPAAAFLLTARWVEGQGVARSFRYADLLRVAAGILLFVLLNVEIADFYSTGTALTLQFAGGGLAQDMTYSLAWGSFALVLFSLGVLRRSKATRAAALVVFLLTIGKVFLHDLWNLGSLYRVGSIVGLAVALLAVSFLTQRFVFSKEQP